MAKKKKGEEPAAPGEEQSKKKGLPIKLIIIAVGGLLVLGGGGFAAWKLFLSPKPAAEAEAKKEPEAKAVEKPGAMMNLEPFVVNLADPAGKRFLKLSLAVDVKDEKVKKEIENRLPQIRDSILLLLTSKTYAEISQVAGKLKLRNDILRIINQALGPAGQVHAVYFMEFVIQ